jgi:hypothetical protein
MHVWLCGSVVLLPRIQPCCRRYTRPKPAIKDQEGALSTFAPPNVVQKSRQQSEKAIKGLKPVCEELLKCIKRSKLRGSVKAMLKEDSLEQARQVVEGAKTNFVLAQMTSLK